MAPEPTPRTHDENKSKLKTIDDGNSRVGRGMPECRKERICNVSNQNCRCCMEEIMILTV